MMLRESKGVGHFGDDSSVRSSRIDVLIQKLEYTSSSLCTRVSQRLRDLSARPNATRATMNTPTRMPEST